MTTRKDFITNTKRKFVDGLLEEDSSSTSSSDSDSPNDQANINLPSAEDLTSSDKIKEWFEKRQQNSEIKKPSKIFLMKEAGFQPAEGQTEEEMEEEIHRKDTEQILKNSQAFYEKFLKFADSDFNVKEESEDEKEDEDDEIADLIAESTENAEREEERRLEAEMDKTTEMFCDYLKSCDNSSKAIDEIDKALDLFKGKSGKYSIQHFN